MDVQIVMYPAGKYVARNPSSDLRVELLCFFPTILRESNVKRIEYLIIFNITIHVRLSFGFFVFMTLLLHINSTENFMSQAKPHSSQIFADDHF